MILWIHLSLSPALPHSLQFFCLYQSNVFLSINSSLHLSLYHASALPLLSLICPFLAIVYISFPQFPSLSLNITSVSTSLQIFHLSLYIILQSPSLQYFFADISLSLQYFSLRLHLSLFVSIFHSMPPLFCVSHISISLYFLSHFSLSVYLSLSFLSLSLSLLHFSLCVYLSLFSRSLCISLIFFSLFL